MKHYILLFLIVLLIGCGNSAQPTARMQSYPRRGDILDRNGICLVTSKPSYILWTIPCEHDAVGFDTMQLAQVFGVNKERLAERFKAALKTPETPSLIFSQIDENIKNSIVKFNIKGLYFTDSPGRLYPDSIAVHTLGYVGNMSKDYAREHGIIYDENRMVGLKGLEMIYNSVLMGDIESAKAGATLTTTLDARLQHYAESLMEDKIGAAVAIAPATGEILMSVSAPFFNPSLLVGRKSGNNYMNLLQDKKHPYINRTISIYYHLPDTLISMMLPNPHECDILHAINGQKIDNSRFEPIDKVAADDDGLYDSDRVSSICGSFG